ncbi:Zn-dependent protease [Clostridium tetanomorphum]|nr:metal dependent protease domain-containing protein [Clostridium tetanomorphum DSM 665]MBP1865056.1 Zn-dependent protease [Clostridium tetanomorphum]NRS83346.1 Zn-dependent protease [Clostridium tetanomorphum]NRZ96546.1 Zn-dependent protease [Clostridium tetanomorphum]SQC01406.1 metal dependent protease domain-containing protein [Clostridium tetanomorphum]
MGIDLFEKILMIPAILIAFTFHEYAHAWVADKLGDKTPKFQGRLTFNPIAHIDPIGFIMILLAGIGWAKPVQVNPRAFKNYYKDDLKVSIAGPLGNILAAVVFSGIIALTYKLVPGPIYNGGILYILIKIFYVTVYLNCILALFNIMPLPGLDGFHVLRDLAPAKFYKFSDVMYRYQMVIFILFIMIPGVSNFLVGKPASRLYGLILNLFNI